MKLEIDLDLNKIDYDAINKQIQKKVHELDILKEYSINSRINSAITEEMHNVVGGATRLGAWSNGVNEKTYDEINDEIYRLIRENVKPYIDEVFNKIPQEELQKIVSELMPRVLMDLMTNQLQSALNSAYCNSQQITVDMCVDRIQSIIGR